MHTSQVSSRPRPCLVFLVFLFSSRVCAMSLLKGVQMEWLPTIRSRFSHNLNFGTARNPCVMYGAMNCRMDCRSHRSNWSWLRVAWVVPWLQLCSWWWVIGNGNISDKELPVMEDWWGLNRFRLRSKTSTQTGRILCSLNCFPIFHILDMGRFL